MPRYLAIDYGHKRIGLAVSDAQGRQACPLKQFPSSKTAAGDAEYLLQTIEEYGIEAIIVGLPLNMDGTEGDQAKITRRYGEKLSKELNIPVEFYDERLTSHAADRLLDQREELTTGQRKARRDALAAHTFLQDFLDHRHRRTDR